MHLGMHSYFIEIVCWKHKAQVPALLCVLFISWNVPPRGINIADQTHISPHDIAKNIDPRRSSRQTVTNDMTGIWHENQWPVGCRWLPLVADQRQTQYHFGYRERGRESLRETTCKAISGKGSAALTKAEWVLFEQQQDLAMFACKPTAQLFWSLWTSRWNAMHKMCIYGRGRGILHLALT